MKNAKKRFITILQEDIDLYYKDDNVAMLFNPIEIAITRIYNVEGTSVSSRGDFIDFTDRKNKKSITIKYGNPLYKVSGSMKWKTGKFLIYEKSITMWPCHHFPFFHWLSNKSSIGGLFIC